MSKTEGLSRRERQIMDIIFELGSGSVREIVDRLPDPPSDSAVRTMLSRLVEKDQLKREYKNGHNVFLPTTPRNKARRSAVARLVKTFFDGSVEQAVSALLSRQSKLDDEELDRIAEMIKQKRKENSK